MRKLTKSTIISNQKEYSHDENGQLNICFCRGYLHTAQINISSSKRPRVSMNQRNLHDRLSESSSDGSMQSFFRTPLANITNVGTSNKLINSRVDQIHEAWISANPNLHLRNITHIDGVPIKEWLGKNPVPVFNHDQYRSVAQKDPYYINYSGSNGRQTGQDENELRKVDDYPTTTTTQSNVILVGSHTTNTKTLHSNISGSSAVSIDNNMHHGIASKNGVVVDVYPTNEAHCEDVSEGSSAEGDNGDIGQDFCEYSL
ncbi:hypothetical protein OROMI_016340 [Orobanche minor]